MDDHARNRLERQTMKPVQVVKERGFVDKADPVTKAEERLLNDHCVPHKVMTRQDDDFAGEGADTNKPGMTRIYDNDRGETKWRGPAPTTKLLEVNPTLAE